MISVLNRTSRMLESQTDSMGPDHSLGRWVWEWTKVVATVVLVFLVVRSFVVEAFKIPTGSMENTLLSGDFLLVSKLAYGASIPNALRSRVTLPDRGDVIVFYPPHERSKSYVKRVVGLPGDTLEMRDKRLYLNGTEVDEPYVRLLDPVTDPGDGRMAWQVDYLVDARPRGIDYRPTRDTWGPLSIPEGALFVLGDNRDNSEDSRYWGFIDPVDIQGRPLFVYFSFDRDPDDPFSWIRRARWSRVGDRIR